MRFIDREEEIDRLTRLARREGGGLAVVHGRRRVGKTRVLTEWCRREDGLYAVADQSAPEVQRRYLAGTVAERLPGFGDVTYPDWRALFDRLAREAASISWRGPVILDELPYLAAASPELPSVLQRWIEREAAASGLVVAIAGSSQHMMQGIVLSSDAPLYGRAREILDIRPLEPVHLRRAFALRSDRELVETFAAWGGVPRYWELASEVPGGVAAQVERLVLDPLGPLHREPDRLLVEELPPAMEVRPVLDAIGMGANRLSEIAGRIGRPATSMARPLGRLIDMRLLRREVPFGEPEAGGRRSLYRIDDPFFRLWFRVVAPERARLSVGGPADRRRILGRHWNGLVAQAFEDLCRRCVPRCAPESPIGRAGPWGPASRWWRGTGPEWDLVSESLDGKRLLLGEVKWRGRPFAERDLARAARDLGAKPPPELPARYSRHEPVRILLVPELARGVRSVGNVTVATVADLLP